MLNENQIHIQIILDDSILFYALQADVAFGVQQDWYSDIISDASLAKGSQFWNFLRYSQVP